MYNIFVASQMLSLCIYSSVTCCDFVAKVLIYSEKCNNVWSAAWRIWR